MPETTTPPPRNEWKDVIIANYPVIGDILWHFNFAEKTEADLLKELHRYRSYKAGTFSQEEMDAWDIRSWSISVKVLWADYNRSRALGWNRFEFCEEMFLPILYRRYNKLAQNSREIEKEVAEVWEVYNLIEEKELDEGADETILRL